MYYMFNIVTDVRICRIVRNSRISPSTAYSIGSQFVQPSSATAKDRFAIHTWVFWVLGSHVTHLVDNSVAPFKLYLFYAKITAILQIFLFILKTTKFCLIYPRPSSSNLFRCLISFIQGMRLHRFPINEKTDHQINLATQQSEYINLFFEIKLLSLVQSFVSDF